MSDKYKLKLSFEPQKPFSLNQNQHQERNIKTYPMGEHREIRRRNDITAIEFKDTNKSRYGAEQTTNLILGTTTDTVTITTKKSFDNNGNQIWEDKSVTVHK